MAESALEALKEELRAIKKRKASDQNIVSLIKETCERVQNEK